MHCDYTASSLVALLTAVPFPILIKNPTVSNPDKTCATWNFEINSGRFFAWRDIIWWLSMPGFKHDNSTCYLLLCKELEKKHICVIKNSLDVLNSFWENEPFYALTITAASRCVFLRSALTTTMSSSIIVSVGSSSVITCLDAFLGKSSQHAP